MDYSNKLAKIYKVTSKGPDRGGLFKIHDLLKDIRLKTVSPYIEG